MIVIVIRVMACHIRELTRCVWCTLTRTPRGRLHKTSSQMMIIETPLSPRASAYARQEMKPDHYSSTVIVTTCVYMRE